MAKLTIIRIIFIFSVMMSIFISLTNAETVSVKNTIVMAGNNIAIPIIVTDLTSPVGGMANIAAFTVSLTYNSTMVGIRSINAGNLGKPAAVNIDNKNGTVIISGFNVSGVSTIPVTLVNIVFIGTVPGVIPLTLTVDTLADSNGVSHPSNIVNGTTTVVPDIVAQYDTDHSGIIEKNEAVSAVIDYFDGVISKQDAITVVVAYFSR